MVKKLFLRHSIENNSLECFKIMCSNGLTHHIDDTFAPLIICIMSRNFTFLKFLLEMGFGTTIIHGRYINLFNAFNCACDRLYINYEMLEIILKHGGKSWLKHKKKESYYHSFLNKICENIEIEDIEKYLKLTLDYGAEINNVNTFFSPNFCMREQ